MTQLKKVSKETLEPIIREALKSISDIIDKKSDDFKYQGEFATNFISNLVVNLLINTSKAFDDKESGLQALQCMFIHIQEQLLIHVKTIAEDALKDFKEVDLNQTKH